MTETHETLDELAEQVERGVAACVAADEVLGLTWLVARGGRARRGAVGHLDAERTRPAQLDSIFRISSMTKPMTAVAALLLVEDGAVALDDPVDEWLPELAGRPVLAHRGAEVHDTVPAERAITLRDLLTFRFGHGMDFSDWTPTPLDAALADVGLWAGPPAPAESPPPDEWIRRLGSVPLQHQPGERWLYHTSADVLGVLIARIVGRPLDRVLQDRLFEPLQMVDTAFWVPPERRDRFGACFGSDGGRRTVYDPVDGQWASPPRFPGGGAGLVSTLSDVERFSELLRRGGSLDGRSYLHGSTVEDMTRDHLSEEQRANGPDPDGGGGWGLGVGVQAETTDLLPAGSYGWDGGLGSVWRTDPASDTTVILLTNQMWTSPEPSPVARVVLGALRP
ncbi:MAG: serine hydrolase domain-containing protein [Microthrixaceae bacterium]